MILGGPRFESLKEITSQTNQIRYQLPNRNYNPIWPGNGTLGTGKKTRAENKYTVKGNVEGEIPSGVGSFGPHMGPPCPNSNVSTWVK